MQRTFLPFLMAGLNTHSSLTHSRTILSNLGFPEGLSTRMFVIAPIVSMTRTRVTRS